MGKDDAHQGLGIRRARLPSAGPGVYKVNLSNQHELVDKGENGRHHVEKSIYPINS